MEIKMLESFLAVAREENITAAAEFLHISQPALSIQLKKLEDEFGKKLLIRGTKGSRKITLTEEGHILRKRAEEILALFDRAKEEIISSDEKIIGNIFIGTGETETVRIFAKVAKKIQIKHPHIKYNISSGNAEHVLNHLDKGLIDFGLIFTEVDRNKYEVFPVPIYDDWGVLMRKDSPLAQKDSITPDDLWDKPLIVSSQKGDDNYLKRWLKRQEKDLNIIASYNLVFNASLLVDEGLGYALCLDKIINTTGTNLCFKPLSPPLKANCYIIWKKYQVFSKATAVFLKCLQEIFPTTF